MSKLLNGRALLIECARLNPNPDFYGIAMRHTSVWLILLTINGLSIYDLGGKESSVIELLFLVWISNHLADVLINRKSPKYGDPTIMMQTKFNSCKWLANLRFFNNHATKIYRVDCWSLVHWSFGCVLNLTNQLTSSQASARTNQILFASTLRILDWQVVFQLLNAIVKIPNILKSNRSFFNNHHYNS